MKYITKPISFHGDKNLTFSMQISLFSLSQKTSMLLFGLKRHAACVEQILKRFQ